MVSENRPVPVALHDDEGSGNDQPTGVARRDRGRVWTTLLLLVFVALVGLAYYLGRQKAEDRYPVAVAELPVKFAVVTETSRDMWSNQRVVRVKGADGTQRVYAYYHERYVNGRLSSRNVIRAPEGKPTTVTVSAPTTEVVVVGTRRGTAFTVNALLPYGQTIGAIGASGAMWVDATGTIVFTDSGVSSTVFGNARYRHYWPPIRPDVPPGAILFKVGGGHWTPLSALPSARGAYELKGRPGSRVTAVVNDSPAYFGDNSGSFTVRVFAEGTAP